MSFDYFILINYMRYK